MPDQHSEWPDVVGWTRDDLRERAQSVSAIAEPRDADLCDRTTDGARVGSGGWIARAAGVSLRWARMQTGTADVATALVLPIAAPDRLPAIVAEWVVVGRRVHVAVLDVEVIGDRGGPLAARVDRVMAPVVDGWPRDFARSDRSAWPPWFADIASRRPLFGSVGVERVPDLRRAFTETLDAVFAAFYMGAESKGPEHADVLAYKSHHDRHFPGRKMLVPKLGEPWTERFLGAHFGPVRWD